MVVADRHGTVAVLNVNGVTLHEQVAPGTYRVISNAPVEGPWEATEVILGVPEACEALEADLGVGGMTPALEATHQESRVQSIYSTVFDLERGRVEIYYLYDYANPWTVDLAEPPEAGVFIRLREHFAARFEQVHAERAAQ